MLADGRVDAAIPASDLDRARAFYSEKLGLTPTEETPEGLIYECAERSRFFLFQSTGRASGDHTQMGWEVADLEAEVADLRSRGVVFEEYDFPGLKTVDGIATVGNTKGAWFKDSEGNLLSVAQRF